MISLAILGLFLPGYLVAGGGRSLLAGAAAFPLSALLITASVVMLALAGLPIRFGNALAVVVTLTLLGYFLSRRAANSGPSAVAVAPETTTATWFPTIIVCALTGLLLTGVLVRTALYPLSGYDTVFRWEALARVILVDQGLAHYPPLSAADFEHYTYPDGIPPLTAAVYWWLYAAWGEPCPRLTSLPIMLQIASCLALVFYAARAAWGNFAGLLATLTLASSTLFISAVAIGQETGYTALGVAGQLACAMAAWRRPEARLVVLAGLFAALGALAREYGLALMLCGGIAIAIDRCTRRYLALFCAVALGVAAPWYLRNWVRTGNPLYSLDTPFGFPVNVVHSALIASYRDQFGLATISPAGWILLALQLFFGALAPIGLGILGVASAGRRGNSCAAAALLGISLWLWSIPFTAGGFEYSLRVLSPTWAALAIVAGAARLSIPGNTKSYGVRGAVFSLLALACAVATVACWSLPVGPTQLFAAALSTRNFPDDDLAVQLQSIKAVEDAGLRPAGVLTDDCYVAAALQRHGKFFPVMVWSPRVEYVFNPQVPPAEVRRRLREDNIMYVAVHQSNLPYLCRFPFYAEDTKNWRVIPSTMNLHVVFFLPP